jgi:nicotinate-nucleotide adenylyltransferase
MNILILGSAFDPPHHGHADTISQHIDNFDKILLVPSYKHPFGKVMRPFDYRLTLTALFSKQFPENKVLVSDIEKHINNGDNPIYTYHVLNALQEKYPECNLSFMIGPDNEEVFDKFYRSNDIQVNWGLVVAEERSLIRSSKVRPLITKDKQNEEKIESMVGKLVSNEVFNNVELWIK